MKTTLYIPSSSQTDVVEISIVEGVATLQANKANVLDASGATVSIAMPTVTDGKENIIRLYLSVSSTTSLTVPETIIWAYTTVPTDYLVDNNFILIRLYTVDNGVSWFGAVEYVLS